MRLLLGCVLGLVVYAQALAVNELEDAIPEVLEPWVDWVLYEHEPNECPFIYNQLGKQTICAWPSLLMLELSHGGGSFIQPDLGARKARMDSPAEQS